ncbi:MAG: septum formation inhibitor Maf [Magnetococcales bacterium]|nr:septum formation inhibitor Maf [Magnetococcales bacterium]
MERKNHSEGGTAVRAGWPWTGKTIRLASASPRRLALLQQVGIEPQVWPVIIDEHPRSGELAEHYVARMAQEKVRMALDPGADFALGADTAVVLNDTILGKPADAGQAHRMLTLLSGQRHQVLTGVALYRLHNRHGLTRVVATDVWFKELSTQDITTYIATGEPMDKAGAYGIQGIGAFMVRRIEGSFSGVVGLPLMETLAMLSELMED